MNRIFRFSMVLALLAGCASEEAVKTPAAAAGDKGEAKAAAPIVYKDFASAMRGIGQCGKDKDKAAAVADQAIQLAKTPDEKATAYARKADIYWNRRIDPRQEKIALEGLAVPGISARRRMASVNEIFKKYYSPKGKAGFAGAERLFKETLARKDFTNAFEIVEVTRVFADIEFDNFRVESAEKRLEALEKLPGVNLASVVNARANLAKRKADFAGAFKQYDRILSGAVPGNRWSAFIDAHKLLLEDNRIKDAIALTKKVEADKKITVHHKETQIAERLVSGYVALKDYKPAEDVIKRLDAEIAKMTFKAYQKESEAASQRLKFSVAVAQDDLERAYQVVKASGNVGLAGDLAGRYAGRGKYARAVELYEIWWPKQNGWMSWMHIDAMRGAVIPYWRAGKRAELAKLLGETVQNMKNVDANRKLGCKIAGECVRNGKLTKADAEKIVAGLAPKAVRDGIPYGAGLLVELGFYEEPKMLNEMRQALFVHQPRNIAPCRYVANAPTDAGSWFASGLMTDANRNINNQRIGKEAAERLITDVAVIRGGKEEGEGAKEEALDSWFYVCYDEHGVHLLFEHNDPKIEEVIRGKTRPTDYEMYLAVGEGAPVYQFGVNPLKRVLDYCPNWNSPHKYFRPLADNVDFSTRPTPYGFATAMNISWDLVYHQLPENGTEWPFEMIHWSRSGGVTWGGTDIWQVSNWGHWKFEGLTPEVKSKIHRVMMYKALARYNAEKNIATGGAIGHWADAELGDPEFYNKALKPLVDKLDAYAKEAEGEPDDATVDRLYKVAVPQWYDFKYFAAELRDKYLSEKFLK